MEGEVPAAENAADNINILEQIAELNRIQQQAAASIAALSQDTQRSYVYVPRERHITPFSGEYDKDGRAVDDFIEEVERVLCARNQSANDKYDFVMSLLRGAALEEVRFRSAIGPKQVSDLFKYLREAFRDKRGTAQLLHDFYHRKQKDFEDVLEYSHGLCQILRTVLKQDPNALPNERQVLRDQFIEGLRDPVLKRELRKFARVNPDSTMIEVREEASLWSIEELPSHSKMCKTKSKGDSVDTEAKCNVVKAPEQQPVTLNDLLRVVAEQGKQIGELTAAVKDLTMQKTNSSGQTSTRPRAQMRFTDDGKPICLKCQGEGHIARNCPKKWDANGQQTSRVQGNETPRSL